jgi:predicted O-methyltransferase YrrM
LRLTGLPRRALRAVRRAVAEFLKTLIVVLPVPLSLQVWAIKRLLPMDPWPRSLVYQQCLADRVLKSHGAAAQGGPFKGMTCIRDADEGCLVPKLLGCYEEELASVAERVITRSYDRVIDVGCASGYWLTGFAMRMPQSQVFGFEIDEEALARCSALTTLNGVQSRVTLLGRCTTADLDRLIQGRTLVFMDCDGPEIDLLDPRLAPALSRADIIVECHDYLNPGITPTLEQRFNDSHSIERITSEIRQPRVERYPGLDALPPEHWAEALAERRPCTQHWLIMRAKTHATH